MAKRTRKKVKAEEAEIIVTTQVEEKPKVPKKPKWRVISGGITLLDKRSFSRGDVFEAEEFEIPKAFRDILEPVVPKEQVVKKAEPKFFIREIVPSAEEQDKEGYEQMYDVVNEAGKKINVKPLTKKKADAMLLKID